MLVGVCGFLSPAGGASHLIRLCVSFLLLSVRMLVCCGVTVREGGFWVGKIGYGTPFKDGFCHKPLKNDVFVL